MCLISQSYTLQPLSIASAPSLVFFNQFYFNTNILEHTSLPHHMLLPKAMSH